MQIRPTGSTQSKIMVVQDCPGYAEIGWTPAPLRNWNEYKKRLASHGERMKVMNINFYPSKLVKWNKK